MNVSAKIINESGKNIDVNKAAANIAAGISNSFNGSIKVDGREVSFQTSVNIEAVESMDNVAKSDHLFVIQDDDGKHARGAVNMIGGKVINIAASDYTGENNTRSAIHEFGHATGLTHNDSSGWKNLMSQIGAGTKVTNEQLAAIITRKTFNLGNNYTGLGQSYPYPYAHDYYNPGDMYRASSLFKGKPVYVTPPKISR